MSSGSCFGKKPWLPTAAHLTSFWDFGVQPLHDLYGCLREVDNEMKKRPIKGPVSANFWGFFLGRRCPAKTSLQTWLHALCSVNQRSLAGHIAYYATLLIKLGLLFLSQRAQDSCV